VGSLSNRFKSYHPIVYSLLLGAFILAIGECISILYLPLYIVKEHQIDPVLIGLIAGVGSLSSTFGGFIAGTLSDFIGRKKVILGSLYASSLIFFGFMLSKHPFFLVIFMILEGITSSFFGPVAKALMADLTVPERRMRIFSIRYTINNVGYAIGPTIGIYFWMKDTIDPFMITGFLHLGYCLLLQSFMKRYSISSYKETDEKVTLRGAIGVIRYDRILFYFVLGGIISTIVHGKWSVSIQQFLQQSFHDGEYLYAILLTVNSIGVILLQYPLTRWTERIRPMSIVAMGSILFAIGMAGFSLSTNWTLFILFMVIFTVGEILVIPAEYIMIDRITPGSMRGMYYGAQHLTQVGGFLGPVVGGFFLSKYGGFTMFMVFALLCIISMLFFWKGQRIQNQQVQSGIEVQI